MSNEDKANFLVGTGMPGLGAFLGPVGDVKKVAFGAAGGTYPMAKFGIPTIVVADGPAGLRINSKREGDNNTYYATAWGLHWLLHGIPNCFIRWGNRWETKQKSMG